jgi:hypothetical protein
MGFPPLTAEQMGQVAGFVAGYISAQRRRAEPDALYLGSTQRSSLQGFFRQDVLHTTRLLVLDGTRIENPPFYSLLLQMGFTSLPDFSQMAAITFDDIVVSHELVTTGLLFHELVHVEQYRQLPDVQHSQLRPEWKDGPSEALPRSGRADECRSISRKFQSASQLPTFVLGE